MMILLIFAIFVMIAGFIIVLGSMFARFYELIASYKALERQLDMIAVHMNKIDTEITCVANKFILEDKRKGEVYD